MIIHSSNYVSEPKGLTAKAKTTEVNKLNKYWQIPRHAIDQNQPLLKDSQYINHTDNSRLWFYQYLYQYKQYVLCMPEMILRLSKTNQKFYVFQNSIK